MIIYNPILSLSVVALVQAVIISPSKYQKGTLGKINVSNLTLW